MESRPSTALWSTAAGAAARDFDYGVGDDRRRAEQEVRAGVAARIRAAGRADPMTTSRERQAYELAALIAEGRR
ncbi:hypothetical protein ACFFOM_04145 [Microlunatus capsulatus]|uniref:Uncharacterized protein n=1 Tax=Microlunatus capsulatus TaxID=99117 RepID=A0ABS4Z6M2_9ACTN|nr:hypothetical protein [Microlunatus capsulatus]MBP2415903.1 hypothetical protein [Microlunatus capsulatus]